LQQIGRMQLFKEVRLPTRIEELKQELKETNLMLYQKSIKTSLLFEKLYHDLA